MSQVDDKGRGQFVDTGSRPATWTVVWLPRPSGAGFSGNWRGFATDMVCHAFASTNETMNSGSGHEDGCAHA